MLNKIIKVDLHIHSKASSYKEDKGIVDESDIEHLDVLFGKLQDNAVNLFSITDHNKFDACLYSAITKKIDEGKYPVVEGVIAGIEFDVEFESAKKPCHIMAYFDAKTSDDYRKIERKTANPDLNKDAKYKREQFETILQKIGLPVVLIAYQRKSLDPLQTGGVNSISDAVTDVPEMIQVGYISGLDLQKPSVEGILRSNLHDLPQAMRSKVAMLMASDCHEWNAYPAHHIGHDKTTVKFSTIKALPTFKGLLMALTSPETRFSRVPNNSPSVIRSFTYEHEGKKKKVELSRGINVIVGENGAGKSTLLNFLAEEKLDSYERRIISLNGIEKDGSPYDKEYIQQSELITKYQTGDLTSSGIYHDAFPSVDTTPFSNELKVYIRTLRSAVEKHISAIEQVHSNPTNITFTPRDKTFNVNIQVGQLFVDNASKESERCTALKNILRELEAESNNSYYSENNKRQIAEAMDLLRTLYGVISDRETKKKNIAKVKNRVISEIKEYNARLSEVTTAEDKETTRYKKSVDNIRKNVLRLVKAQNDSCVSLPPFPSFSNSRDLYFSSNQIGGFVFSAYATFIEDVNNLETNLCATLFNKPYHIQRFDNLASITSRDDWESCVTGASSYDDIAPCLEKDLDRFLQDNANVRQEIKRQGSISPVPGSTLGEQALIYYEILVDSPPRQSTIFFFDQPEDNISNKKIVEALNPTISHLRDSYQVIFVTHNPLMVVNLDADNVVFLDSKKKNSDRALIFSVASGCLEDEENHILEKVADQMDGGEDAVERRLRRYGR